MKIYCAGKFHKSVDNKRLDGDYRLKLDTSNVEYIGPHYNCEVSSKYIGSSAAIKVITRQMNMIYTCDLFIAVLEPNISVGTICEINHAISLDKQILILYNEESLEEYWYFLNQHKLIGCNMVKYTDYDTVYKRINKFL